MYFYHSHPLLVALLLPLPVLPVSHQPCFLPGCWMVWLGISSCYVHTIDGFWLDWVVVMLPAYCDRVHSWNFDLTVKKELWMIRADMIAYGADHGSNSAHLPKSNIFPSSILWEALPCAKHSYDIHQCCHFKSPFQACRICTFRIAKIYIEIAQKNEWPSSIASWFPGLRNTVKGFNISLAGQYISSDDIPLSFPANQSGSNNIRAERVDALEPPSLTWSMN